MMVPRALAWLVLARASGELVPSDDELSAWAATRWNVSAVTIPRGGGKAAKLVVIDSFLPTATAESWHDAMAATWRA